MRLKHAVCRHRRLSALLSDPFRQERAGGWPSADAAADAWRCARAKDAANRHRTGLRWWAAQFDGTTLAVGACAPKCVINGQSKAFYKFNNFNILRKGKQVFACDTCSFPANRPSFGKFPLDHGFENATHALLIGMAKK
jgi:hypothetical protein